VAHVAFDRVDHRPWPVPDRPWLLRQSWLDLAFLHWPIPAAALRPLVPETLAIEERDGTAWIGVVPFRMEAVTGRGMPPVPGLSAFPELNLRTYVSHGGKPGVWFFSLDADKAPAVWAARRFFHLPYHRAAMRCHRRGEWPGGWIEYESRRRGDPAAAFRARYRPTSPAREPLLDTLEHWLTERYCLYAEAPGGRIERTEIHHLPWPLCDAEIEIEESSILSPLDLAVTGPPLAHFSARQDVVTWLPVAVD
jgi:hypothetical protein